MTVFDLYESAIAFTRRNARVADVQLMLRTAESVVIDASGGTNSAWLKSHLRDSHVATVSDVDNVSRLPDGAGPILHGGGVDEDGNQWSLLSEEESSLAGKGSIYKRAIVRNGNALTFYGIPSKTEKTITVTYVSSFRGVSMIDGVFVSILEGVGSSAGKRLRSYLIERPENLVFPEEYLANSIIRVFEGDNIAKDYEISGNTTYKSKALLYSTQNPVEVVSASVSEYKTEGNTYSPQYPAKIARCSLPLRLRPAVLEYFKHLESREQKYLQNMLTIVGAFTRDIS